jgi:ubiquinone/menaquinone biosynthesis C-methylase UbiE
MTLTPTRIALLLLAAVMAQPACGEPGAAILPGSGAGPVDVARNLTGADVQAPADSGPPGGSPLLNRYYQGADFDRWTDVFERRGREVFDQRFQIVHAAGVREGMRVADIGAGTGFFAALFARAVGPEGVVYAVDTSPDFVAGIEERARTYRVKNLVPIVNTQQGTGLEPNSIDLAFLCDTYHHFEDPRAMLDSIYQALAPYGSLIIIDMHRIPGLSSPWTMGHVRAGRNQVVSEVEAAGFRLMEEPRLLRDNFYLRFEKLSDEPDLKVGPIEIDP